MDKYEIATLADDYHSKRQRRDMLAMRNVWGLTSDEAKKAAIEYHIADAECIQAYIALEAAKMKKASPSREGQGG